MNFPLFLLHEAVNQSIFEALNRLGDSAGLEALHWTAAAPGEIVVIEGRPVNHRGIRECAKWAATLGMKELVADEEGHRVWSVSSGAWYFELIDQISQTGSVDQAERISSSLSLP